MSDYIYWVSVVEDTLVHQPGVHKGCTDTAETRSASVRSPRVCATSDYIKLQSKGRFHCSSSSSLTVKT